MAKRSAPVEYRQYVLSFVDLLGFKTFVESNDAQTVLETLDTVQQFSDSIAPDRDERDTQIVTFSDCVVRARLYDAEEPLTSVFTELNLLVLIQMELVHKGVVVRGGVTLGEAYINEADAVVFGPAMNRAYELESRVAVYPRIIVDDPLVVAIDASEREHPDEVAIARRLLRRDEARYSFLDYLRNLQTDEPGDQATFLHSHFALITQRLSESNHRKPEFPKYSWLAEYHNGVIQELPSQYFDAYGLRREALLVP